MSNFYGRYTTSNQYFATLVDQQLRISVFGTLSTHGWATYLGFFGGINSGTPSVQLSLYRADSPDGSFEPYNLMGKTAVILLDGAPMTTAAGGVIREYPITANYADSSGLQTAVRINAGTRYGIGVLSTGGVTAHKYVAPGEVTEANAVFYEKTGVTDAPAAFVSSNEVSMGSVSAYIKYEPNQVPAINNTTMLPSGSITTYTPTFTGSFSDPDEIYGDYVSSYEVQLREVGQVNSLWYSPIIGTTPAERVSKTFSVPYTGPGLSVTKTYEWQYRVRDSFGEVSPLSTWKTFNIQSGAVQMLNIPMGRQTVANPSFQGRWTHATSLTMTELTTNFYQNNILVYTSVLAMSPAKASGTTFTIPLSGTGGLGFVPTAGVVYTYGFQGKDSSGIISTESARGNFSINALPNTPSNLSPNSGTGSTSPPLFNFNMIDTDDTVATGLTGKIQFLWEPVMTNQSFALGTVSGWQNNTGAPSGAGSGMTVTGGGIVIGTSPALDSGKGDNRYGVIAVTANTQTATGASSSNPGWYTINQELPASYVTAIPSELYTASMMMRTTNANLQPKVVIYFYNSAFGFISAHTNPDQEIKPANINTWIECSTVVAAPTGAFYFRVGAKAETTVTGASTGTVYIDELDIGLSARTERAATLKSGTISLWQYQSVDTDFPVKPFVWSWRARGYDGKNLGGWSSMTEFQYGSGPVITITAPTSDQIVDTITPTISWSSTGTQTGFRIFINDVTKGRGYGEAVAAFMTTTSADQDAGSGYVTSIATDYTIPPGYLRHDRSYEVYVAVIDSGTGVQGYSVARPFRVFFTEPKKVNNFNVFPSKAKFDTFPSTIKLTWMPTEESPDAFQYYTIYRTDPGGDRNKLVELTSPAQTAWTDNHPKTGQEYTYDITQTIRMKNINDRTKFIESDRYKGTAQIDLHYAVLSSIDRPQLRVPLKFWSSRQVDHRADTRTVIPWGEDKPIITMGETDYVELSLEIQFIDDASGSGKEQVNALLELIKFKRIVCYRDPIGRRLFGLLFLSSEDDMRGRNIYNLRVQFIETAHVKNI